MKPTDEITNLPGALAALLLAILALLLAGGRASAAGSECMEQPDDLPCELRIPPEISWWSYFNPIGDGIEYDDECGMEAPVSQSQALEGRTWLGLEIPATPHQLCYEMLIKATGIARGAEAEIVVLDMTRTDAGRSTPVLELRLDTRSYALELSVHSDQALVRLSGAEIDPEGSRVAVELAKSRGAETGDGEVRLLIDDQLVLEETCLHLWQRLPDAVRLGVVEVESTEDLGTLDFQPLGFSHRFFADPR